MESPSIFEALSWLSDALLTLDEAQTSRQALWSGMPLALREDPRFAPHLLKIHPDEPAPDLDAAFEGVLTAESQISSFPEAELDSLEKLLKKLKKRIDINPLDIKHLGRFLKEVSFLSERLHFKEGSVVAIEVIDCIEFLGGEEDAKSVTALHDWYAGALSRMRRGFHPSVDQVDTIISAFKDISSESLSAFTSLELQTRTDEEREVIAEFLAESLEGLEEADELLVESEMNTALDLETINAIFRIFHSIKGVAAYLKFEQIKAVTHSTETLLDRLRSGRLQISTSLIDLLFDATAQTRALLDEVRAATEAERALRPLDSVDGLLVWLKQAVESKPLPPIEHHPVAPDARLGEILQERGAVSLEILDRALAAQAEAPERSGRLGQFLLRERVPAKSIATALRDQRKTAEGRQSSALNGLEPQRNGAAQLREIVKVDLGRVDQLVETIGELVVIESMIAHGVEPRQRTPKLNNALGQLTKITRDLQDMGVQMRMVPLRSLFNKMSRLVRDVSRQIDKDVRVLLSGEGTEMDRTLVEKISDPLLHLLRNAVDHGIEEPEARRRAGKPEQGRVWLSAGHEAGGIVVEIRDDGGGIDRARVLEKARANGIVDPDERLSPQEIDQLIFHPGLSTTDEVSDISGRGVGMDVVKKNIEAIRGRIRIESTPGEGTCFRLLLPLTLAIIDGMLITCGAERYIIPTLSIIESLQPKAGMISRFAGQRELISARGEVLPLLRLQALLGVEGAKGCPEDALVVLLETLGVRFGLMVDDVVLQQQVVIKRLSEGCGDTPLISGGAILSDGRVGLILNIEAMGALASARHAEGSDGPRPTHRAASTPRQPSSSDGGERA